jgi:phosphoserine phosphatase RsbU/P
MMLANTEGELELKIARGKGKTTLSGTTFQTSEKIPRDVFRTGKSQTVGDLMDVNIQGQHDRTIAVGIRHVLCVPLKVTPMSEAGARDMRVIGVLYLDGREKSSIMSEATRASLEAFATQAALAIESARLYAESAEKARIDRDLRIAAEIQRALLPEPRFDSITCDLAADSIPCRTVGGDFFDYIEIGDGSLGFALGDVAGKGPPAALLAAAVQTNFAAQAPISDNPAETMARVNKALLRRAIEARFATMFYGAITNDGSLSYCNAGQEPPLVVRASSIEWLEEGGPVLGLLAIATYAYATVQLYPGDLVVVCSDGVTEARNLANDEFGRDRLVDTLQARHGQKPDAVLEHLLAVVKQFSQGAAQADDITALILRYRGPRPS